MSPSRTCDFDLLSGEFAWIDETKQQLSAGPESDSVLQTKRTDAWCREISSFNQQLNNGRVCHSSYQCKSMLCENGKCKGIEITENCHSHEDCDATRYCKRSNQWPWMYECAKMRTSYEQCVETYECLPS